MSKLIYLLVVFSSNAMAQASFGQPTSIMNNPLFTGSISLSFGFGALCEWYKVIKVNKEKNIIKFVAPIALTLLTFYWKLLLIRWGLY